MNKKSSNYTDVPTESELEIFTEFKKKLKKGRKQAKRQAASDSDTNPKKPLVLFYYDKPSWFLVICTMLLFLVALGCLDRLFGMDDSAFPSWEAGYYLEVDRDPVFNKKEDVWTEFVEAGSWASIYRGLLPVVIIIYFSFVVGYGSVGCRSREIWFFSCFACLCIISYCLAWIVPPKLTILLIARILLFVFAGLMLLLSLGSLSLFRYTKCSPKEPLLPLLLSTYLKGSENTDADCGVLQMSQRKHKSARDLLGFARLAHDHWKKYRPKLYQHLKKKGVLYDHLFEAGRQADEYMMKAQEKPGFNLAMDYLPAKEVALRTWIYLPDVDDETDESERVIPD